MTDSRFNVDAIKRALLPLLHDKTRDAADSIFFHANQYMTEEGIDDEGTLRGSGVVVPNDEGGHDVVWLAEHASWIHDGTAGHPVSEEGQEAIKAWVGRKLKPARNRGETQEQANERVAQAVIWKIRHHGTDPRPFLIVGVERYQDTQDRESNA